MLVTSTDQVDEIIFDLAQLGEADFVAVDTETTGLHIYKDDFMLGMSVSYENFYGRKDWYIPVGHVDSDNFACGDVVVVLGQFRGTLVFHNAEFDWAVIRKETGLDLSTHDFWDTQTVDWLLDENLPHGLKEIAARLWGVDAKAEQNALKAIKAGRSTADIYTELRNGDDPQWTGKGTAKAARVEAQRRSQASKKTWATLTAEDIAEYAAMDTRLTLDLCNWQMEEVQIASPEIPYETLDREFRFQRVLYEMMRVGIKIDPKLAEEARARALERMSEIEPLFGGINLNSPKQLGHLLYEEWGIPVTNRSRKTGAPSTDKATLEELEGHHPNIDKLLEYRQLTKAVGTYFTPMLEKRDSGDRIHTHFNAHRTVTGRLSSSDPNLQNIPKESTNAEVRAMFVPGPGLELWEFDLSQAEMRVMAGWAKDENMIGALMEGRDLHAETAYGIWGEESVGSEFHRTIAKNVGYGYPYGIGPAKVAVYIVKGTGQPVNKGHVAQGASILNGYARTYPGLARLMKGTQRHVEQYGFIPLHVPGRYRRYKGPGYHVWETYTALNSIVQGAIGEFMKDVMLLAAADPSHGNAPGCFWRMCLQIHDSLVCEIVPGHADAVLLTLQEIATKLNPFPLPMTWDAKNRTPGGH